MLLSSPKTDFPANAKPSTPFKLSPSSSSTRAEAMSLSTMPPRAVFPTSPSLRGQGTFLPSIATLNREIQAAQVLKSLVSAVSGSKTAGPASTGAVTLPALKTKLAGNTKELPAISAVMKKATSTADIDICKKSLSSESCKSASPLGTNSKCDGKKPIRRCSVEGCSKYARKGGICVSHGAKVKVIRCKMEGCGKYAVRQGVCKAHGAKVKRCSMPDCVKGSVRGGVCISHGATIKTCKVENCTKVAKRGGVCIGHGSSSEAKRAASPAIRKRKRSIGQAHVETKEEKIPLCAVGGCEKVAKTRGMCNAHAQVTVTFCMVTDCSYFAKVQGQCLQHYSGKLSGGGPDVGTDMAASSQREEDCDGSAVAAIEDAKELQFTANVDPANRYYY